MYELNRVKPDVPGALRTFCYVVEGTMSKSEGSGRPREGSLPDSIAGAEQDAGLPTADILFRHGMWDISSITIVYLYSRVVDT